MKDSSKNRSILTLVGTILILIVLALVSIWINSNDEKDHEDEIETEIIYPGRGLLSIGIGNSYGEVIRHFGVPEDEMKGDDYLWISYRGSDGIDFLISNETDRIIEMRFNDGFDGSLENGVSVGMPMDDVILPYGDDVPLIDITEDNRSYLTDNRSIVLYRIPWEEDDVFSYIFFDREEGFLVWADNERMITQIVVY